MLGDCFRWWILFRNNSKPSTSLRKQLNNIDNNVNNNHVVEVSDLREDVVISSSETEKNIIKQNFPKEKNGYLVVSKVIEN